MNRMQSHLTEKTRRALRRLSALLLACGLCVPLLMFSGSAAGSSKVNVLADSTVKLWEWSRVYTQGDLPEGNFEVMLLFEDTGGNKFMVDGNSIYKDSWWDNNGLWFDFYGVSLPRGVVFGNDVCLTLEPVSHMRMSYVGRNKKNQGPKEYNWYADGIPGRIGHLVPTRFNKYFVAEGSEQYLEKYSDFCVQTSEIAFSDGYPKSGRVMLYDEIGGVNDCPVFVEGNLVYARNSPSTDMAQFVMYVGKEVEYSAVTHDVTVQSGQVQNVDGHVYVCPDVTITVEPGAVLSIQGNLYNNGYIYNQGDVVLQKNACIQTLLLEGDGGAICCDGGDLILMSGARMATGTCGYSEQYGNGFLLKNGATCTNYGTIILPANGRLESGAVLDNRKNGWLLQGYRVPSSREGTLHKFTQPQLRYSALESTFACIYVEPLRQYFFGGSVTSLYLGHDTLALNQGTIQMNGALQTETDAELRHEGGGLLNTTPTYQTYRNYLNRVYP